MSTEFHLLTVQSVEKLTKDSVVISFELPTELASEYQYIQGQHLTLKTSIDGQEIRRSYSICNGVNQQNLQVGVKRIEGGVFSNFANDQLKPGMRLDVMPPQGHFYHQLDANSKKHYLMIAAGSGITPMLSHIQSIFDNEPDAQITLIYGNKSTTQMMFRERLSFIKNAYLSRLHWINLLTNEETEAKIFNGRINANKLVELEQKKLIDLKQFNEVFLCGPESMINNIVEFFKGNPTLNCNLHYELFHSDSAEQASQKSQQQRAEKYSGRTASVAVKVAGRKTLMALPMGGQSILDAALENGSDVPFACKAGVCATCKAKVIKGNVEMDSNHSLTQQEVEDGIVLTCQAHPISDEVEVDFDYS